MKDQPTKKPVIDQHQLREKPSCCECGSENINFRYKRAMDHHPVDEKKVLAEAADYLAQYVALVDNDVSKVMCVADTLTDIAAMVVTREDAEARS